MIDIEELRRKVNSADIVDHIDLHANIKPFLSEMIDRLEAAEKAVNEAYQRGYETGQEEVEKERDNVAQQLVQSEIGKREISEAHNAVTGRLSDLANENTALRAETKNLREGLKRMCLYEDAAVKETKALRAKIEQMERQEPVAFALYSGWALKSAYHKEHEACDQRDRRQLSADLGGSLEAYRVVPLYALPGAQTQGEGK